MTEKLNAVETTGVSLTTHGGISETIGARGIYDVRCYDAEGNFLWEDQAVNVCTYQGKNYVLDTVFVNGVATPTWYMSLITAGTATTASTYASPTVTEIGTGVITSNTRPTVGWSASASGAKSATTTTFTFTSGTTVTGNMLVTATGANVSTVGNTGASGGVLFSAASFTGGSRTVNSGDSIQVTYSISI